MTENKEKSGAGKFFLGALLGAAAGAIAGRFVSAKANKDDGEELEDECGCGPECDCKEKAEEEKKAEPKKADKKSEK